MSNWYGTARSNYFAVKDMDAFLAWAEALSLEVLNDNEMPTLVAIAPATSTDTGDWPSHRFIDVEDENVEDPDETEDEVDIVQELAAHLADGQVAVLISAGAEKLRYVTGHAVAFDNTGKAVEISLSQIYTLAFDTFGVHPTAAEY